MNRQAKNDRRASFAPKARNRKKVVGKRSTKNLSLIHISIALSKMLGGALPIAAKALRLDPALMASPLITTIVDSCSVLVYFNIAVAVLHIG